MVAIMKQVQLKTKEPQKKANRAEQLGVLEPILVETIIEIYDIQATAPLIGANVDVQKVKSQLHPKNISRVHKVQQELE